jgi:ethanolaminephosphotransferase
LSYNYVWGPLADALLKYVPENVAPNTLTLIGTCITHKGFLCVVMGHILVMTIGEFGEPVSRPVLITFACLMLIYQTLDNIDGKQARRTSTSYWIQNPPRPLVCSSIMALIRSALS